MSGRVPNSSMGLETILTLGDGADSVSWDGSVVDTVR
jgi:hypothetical protein